ncbi:efflux RND transporter periplasmic adaptor subunit [Methyloraptor flagellatus]|uniref:Efflux RND transporter periplasmic adaptor subunit n=1 Tax=Methyloraptor flagellatus TaxID=3162530 RepID=A0AAU7X7X9_9HYPH
MIFRRFTATVAIAAIGIAAAVPAAFAQGAPAGGPPVTVAKPIVKDVQEWAYFTGRFDATASVDVRARVGGYLEKVHFVDGSLVKKGDLLFTIDPRPYRASADQSEAAVKVSETAVEFAKNDLDRAMQLQKSGNITDQTADQRRQAYLQAQAQLAGNRAALVNAKLNLEFTEVRAPMDGRISRRLVAEGNIVAANDTLLTTIVTIDPIDFYFDVDEQNFLAYTRNMHGASGSIVGDNAFVGTSDEAEPARKATIDFADNRVDALTGTLRVRAKVPNPDGFLTPGLFGRIKVPASKMHPGVLVPDEAIASDQTRRIVYQVADDGSVTPKPVVPGPKIDGYRLIRSGIDGSEQIVVNGIVRIRPGVKVTPQPTTLPPVRNAP